MKFDRLKSGQPVTTDWRTINTLLAAVEALARRLSQLEHPNERNWQKSKAHPFEIYQTSTWLKYKVRTGYAITTGAPFEPANVETEFTLTSGVAKYYFVLTFSSSSAATITTSSTLPAWGIDVIPIGWVDTATYAAVTHGQIEQFTHDNIFSPCVVDPP